MTASSDTPLYCVTGALCKMGCDPAERECEGFNESNYVNLKRRLRAAQQEQHAPSGRVFQAGDKFFIFSNATNAVPLGGQHSTEQPVTPAEGGEVAEQVKELRAVRYAVGAEHGLIPVIGEQHPVCMKAAALLESLASQVEQLRRERDGAIAAGRTALAMLDASKEVGRAAESECAKLREDAERLDWAESHPEAAMRKFTSWWAACGQGAREHFFGFRGRIDAARKDSPHG